MGALTSKPYAFTARPWELRTLNSIDCFDSFGSLLRIDVRGLDVMRILPRISESINEEWISDRVRFSYDGLKCQRITSPLFKTSSKNASAEAYTFKKITWAEVYLSLLKNVLLSKALRSIDVIVGKLQSLNSFYSSLFFLHKILSLKPRLNLNVYYNEALNLNIKRLNYRSDYLLPSITVYKSFDFLLLLNTNLRLELPVLNIRVRRAVVSRLVPVFNWGVNFDYNYTNIYLGNALNVLLNMLKGRHPISKILLFKNKPLIVAPLKSEFRRIYQIFSLLCKKYAPSSIFNGLASTTSSLMMFDYGILSNNKLMVSNRFSADLNQSIFIFSDDEVCFDVNDYNNVFYFGHHGDRNALLSDLIIPTPFMFEERSSVINLLGNLNQNDLVLNPPNLARTAFSLFNAFFLIIKSLLKSSSKSISHLDFLNIKPFLFLFLGFVHNQNKVLLLPHINLKITPFLETMVNNLDFTIKNTLLNSSIISSNSASYYSSNSILRSSHVMALSISRFQRYNQNFN